MKFTFERLHRIHFKSECKHFNLTRCHCFINSSWRFAKYYDFVCAAFQDTEALKNLNLSHNELREKGGMVIGNALGEYM